MPFFSISDADLWDRGTQDLKYIIAEGGSEGLDQANFVLGRPENNAPVIALLRMSPGYVLPNHGHNCYRFEVIVQGELSVGEKTYGVGTLMLSEPGNLYGPHVAGAEGCTTVEVFSTFDASHKILARNGANIEEFDIATKSGAEQVMEVIRKQFS